MKQQFSLSDLWMPIMMRFLDVEHTEGAESNAGILELGQRNNENDIDDGAPIQLERDYCRGVAFSDDSKTLSEEHQVNGGSHVLPNDS